MSRTMPLPPKLLVLISQRSTFQQLWRMHGTTDAGDAMAYELLRRKWTDGQVLASLVGHPVRPLSVADAQSAIRRQSDILRSEAREAAKVSANGLPVPEIVRIYEAKPTTAAIKIGSYEFTAPVVQLATRAGFVSACMESVAILPGLPDKRNFAPWLADQLAHAERVYEAGDVADDAIEIAVIERAILVAGVGGERMTQVQDGRIVVEDGYRHLFLPQFLLQRVHPIAPISAKRAAAILRKLGWFPHSYQTATLRCQLWRQSTDGEAPAVTKESKLRALIDATNARDQKEAVADWASSPVLDGPPDTDKDFPL